MNPTLASRSLFLVVAVVFCYVAPQQQPMSVVRSLFVFELLQTVANRFSRMARYGLLLLACLLCGRVGVLSQPCDPSTCTPGMVWLSNGSGSWVCQGKRLVVVCAFRIRVSDCLGGRFTNTSCSLGCTFCPVWVLLNLTVLFCLPFV